MIREDMPGLYVHVPFCRAKCPYCHFYSVTSLAAVPDWLHALDDEAQIYRDRFNAFDTLYLGGGTPSLLDAPSLTRLMQIVDRHFTVTPGAEITIEVNPSDVTTERLSLYGDLGINRISVGVQSFHDQELRVLGRRHTASHSERSLELLQTSGLASIGIDLIYGFQRQTLASWQETIEKAVSFNPHHISCYELTIEDHVSHPLRPMRLLGEKTRCSFFLTVSNILHGAGYSHYEVSNFARPGHRSRHNEKYWRHVPYLGLGPAAHSFLDGVRWWNYPSLDRYCRSLAKGDPPVEDSEHLTDEHYYLEDLYLGFRTRDGITRTRLDQAPGSDRIISELVHAGLVELKHGNVAPTTRGFLVADSLPLLFCG